MSAPTNPKCPECSFDEDFATFNADEARVMIVSCPQCGHVISAFPDPQFLAHHLVHAFTKGARDGAGHPVMRVIEPDNVFG